jgi:hypothetical protein
MKKLYYLQIVAGLCIMVFQSCTKDAVSDPSAISSSRSIDVIISPNQTYQLNLAASTAVNIFKQAAHYQTSETFLNPENGSFTYTYLPDANYKGKDQVVLSATSLITTSGNPSGCPNSNHAGTSATTANYSTTYTTINITVGK